MLSYRTIAGGLGSVFLAVFFIAGANGPVHADGTLFKIMTWNVQHGAPTVRMIPAARPPRLPSICRTLCV